MSKPTYKNWNQFLRRLKQELKKIEREADYPANRGSGEGYGMRSCADRIKALLPAQPTEPSGGPKT